jgi:hypothetical protein
MVVHRPDKTDAAYPLKEWDVITHIGDTPIDNQGMVKIDKDLRVQFRLHDPAGGQGRQAAADHRACRQDLKIELPVSAEYPTLVADLHGGYPSYFVYGPMVFSIATRQMLGGFENNAGNDACAGLLEEPAGAWPSIPPTPDLQELVVISSPFFPHKLANGYSNPPGSVVYSINGTPLKSLKHLVELLRDLKDPFVTIEFAAKGGEGLVFSRQAHHGRDRRHPHRQWRARAGLAGHAGGVAGETGRLKKVASPDAASWRR